MNNIESTVVSSRVRLARNLADYPFPGALKNAGQGKKIVREVSQAATRLRGFRLYAMDEISETVAQSLCDDHLISMAYRKISAVDNALSKELRFAFDDQLGYLTACPTNLGTGLRASVMLFLPGLTRMNKMNRLVSEVSELGHTVRGLYGEGSAAEGYMYQISNEVTLGVTEDYITSEVNQAVLGIVNLEAKARKALCAKEYVGIKDECCRAFGILANCQKIEYKEFLELASAIKLGVALDILETKRFSDMDALIAAVRPANLNILIDEPLTARERDVYRAEKCRRVMEGMRRKA